MKNKLLPILVILSILFNIHLSGQNLYRSGFIIVEQDTIRGFIDDKDWEGNPVKIAFKSSMNDTPQEYTVADIDGFGFDNSLTHYISRVVQMEESLDNMDQLTTDSTLYIKEDTLVFLLRLVSGEKELYAHRSRSNRYNFYINNDNNIQLLRYKRYLKNRESRYIMRRNIFITQLRPYLEDCPQIAILLRATTYSLSDMIKLFKNYYECLGNNENYVTIDDFGKKIKSGFGILGGINATTLKFSGIGSSSLIHLIHGDFGYSFRPVAGIYYDLVFDRTRQYWSFCNELLYSTYNVSGSHTVREFNQPNFFTTTDSNIGYHTLRLNSFARYTTSIKELPVFINVGISSGWCFNEQNYRRIFSQRGTLELVEELKAISSTRSYSQGILLGMGIKKNKLSLQTRLEITNGTSAISALTSITQQFYLMVGYEL